MLRYYDIGIYKKVIEKEMELSSSPLFQKWRGFLSSHIYTFGEERLRRPGPNRFSSGADFPKNGYFCHIAQNGPGKSGVRQDKIFLAAMPKIKSFFNFVVMNLEELIFPSKSRRNKLFFICLSNDSLFYFHLNIVCIENISRHMFNLKFYSIHCIMYINFIS